MSREEIALQLTLKVLDNFKYDTNDFGGNTLHEHAKANGELAAQIFNTIYEDLYDE